MPGRRLIAEQVLFDGGYGRPLMVQRRIVLHQTLAVLERAPSSDHYHELAAANLARWARRAEAAPAGAVEVVRGDWGEVTGALTRRYGVCFAALNMANAFSPGGAYIEGTAAQEENMFRRTDCHLRVDDGELDLSRDRYRTEMTELLSAVDGRVYLDTERPRVCLRGPEDRTRADLGYAWLADDELFPFFELRAAAQDIRRHGRFDEDDARARIEAQLDTLLDAGIRHAVLSAFGCGAFRNPPGRVAAIYREALDARREDFDLIAFAIFDPGYGPDNYTPFAETLG